ncbi:MAG: indolepyruvate oxidoreductase subunit beta family protein [Pseudomonadota bacterium]
MDKARAIKIAVTAIGGQGGGVLANWIGRLGEDNGFISQMTSVPGVAQRTGATVYYIEWFPLSAAQATGKDPVLALMPVPGDVDIVIAAELMEAGRAILRGFISPQTTLIASSHRDYAISEKSGLGDGRQRTGSIIEAAEKASKAFIVADMAAAAAEANAAISAVLFGALAGSGALPVERARFEDQIIKMGRAVEQNLHGFSLGFDLSQEQASDIVEPENAASGARDSSLSVTPLLERMQKEFPNVAHFYIREGLKRTVDFQDVRYAGAYLDRLKDILDIDRNHDGERRDWRLTQAVAKHLALWMTYEDSIRVADLKTRKARFESIRKDIRVEDRQIANVHEFLHPRVEEFCDILPVGAAQFILNNVTCRKLIGVLLGKGKRIPTTKLRGFLPLYALSSLRFMRRSSFRFKLESEHIAEWLKAITDAARNDYDLAIEVAQLQRLIKGYGDTHERGLKNYKMIMDFLKHYAASADAIRQLREAALKDEEGAALRATIKKFATAPQIAA